MKTSYLPFFALILMSCISYGDDFSQFAILTTPTNEITTVRGGYQSPPAWYRLMLYQDNTYVFSVTSKIDCTAELFVLDVSLPVSIGISFEKDIQYKFTPSFTGYFYIKISCNIEFFFHYVNTTPIIPTPTPTVTPLPTATPTPQPDIVPMWKFPFENEDEFIRISGGINDPPFSGGDVFLGEIPKGVDGKGVMFIMMPGQVELIMLPSLNIGDNPIFLRASVQATAGGAAIAIATLDGSMDGSIATNIPANSTIFKDQYHWMYLLYKCPGDTVIPILQVSNLNGTQPVIVYLDEIEVFLLTEGKGIPERLLRN